MDLTACADLSENRGWPREEHKWGLLLSAGTGYGIDDPQGGLAAACVLTRYEPGLTALGMVLVAERHARQGIGRRLTRHVLEEAGTIPVTLHATPYGQPLYEELGFKTTGRAEMVRGRFVPPSPADVSRETSAVRAAGVSVRPATAEDLTSILRLDHEVFGADRTHLVTRLPAFADHLRVAEAGGDLVGFGAIWPNMDTHVIGPLIARDTLTAQALITSLAQASDRPLRTDVDVRHEELLHWLKARGLAHLTYNAVMNHGAPDLPGDWTRRFAPLTVAAG
ncbi:GNAT family N-acetyltransferase [Streptomyces sp. NPDC060194]|uniref:GNAT family N-acetyltransferase n=1 Tax=Streptomyces sp. NPDC060194 TaxID=3347069 RepID=UPI003651C88D